MIDGKLLLEKLDPDSLAVARQCGALAAARGDAAYLVGGRVRDLMIERESDDIDIVVVGDGMALAQALARARGGRLTRHHAFQTARVDLPEGGRVDIATARREQYQRPGLLPQVEVGSLQEDLARRDFTVNTLAIALGPDEAGRLVDPFDGAADIAAGRIRILHERSFADDPTRMLRAVRFSLRLGYALEPGTERALEDGVQGGYLESISGHRLRREVEKLFGEQPVRGPVELGRRGLLTVLHAGLVAERELLVDLDRERASVEARLPADAALPPAWTMVLAVTALELAPQPRWDLVRRLRLSRQEREPLLDSGAPWTLAADRLAEPGLAPSEVSETLDAVSLGGLTVGLASLRGDERAARLRSYLGEWRWVRPELRGEDLIELGCPSGRQLGELLRRLRRARLDGEVSSVEQEARLVRRVLEVRPN